MPEIHCPACDKPWPSTDFECLPLDNRCRRCIPSDVAMRLYDKRVQQAGHTMAQILDANSHNVSLKPLETMVSLAYDCYGGPRAFMEDAMNWIKDLALTGRGKGVAVSHMMKLLQLHAKVDRMRLDEDFKRMDDETLRATIKMKMMALFAEAATEEGKKTAMKTILGETNG